MMLLPMQKKGNFLCHHIQELQWHCPRTDWPKFPAASACSRPKCGPYYASKLPVLGTCPSDGLRSFTNGKFFTAQRRDSSTAANSETHPQTGRYRRVPPL